LNVKLAMDGTVENPDGSQGAELRYRGTPGSECDAVFAASPPDQREAIAYLTNPLTDRSPLTRALHKRKKSFSLLIRRLSSVGGGSDGFLEGDENEDEIDHALLAGDQQDFSVTGSSSFQQAFFNGVNTIAGIGVLSLPFAFLQTGYFVGVSFLIYLCLITNYTGKLIGKCMMADTRIRTMGDLGSFAFGARGRNAITFVFVVELFAALSMYLTLMGDNLHKIFGNHRLSRETLIILSLVVVLPTCWTDKLELLSNLSIIGMLSTFFLLFTLIETGLTVATDLPEGGSFHNLHMAEFKAFNSIANFPYAIGLEMAGFAGHAVFPSIYDSLKEKERFFHLIDVVYLCASLLYIAMGFLGYMLFTSHTQQEVTLNLYDVAGGTFLVKLNTWLVIINPATKFALTLNPLVKIVEQTLWPRTQASCQNEDQSPDRDACWNSLFDKTFRTGLCCVSLMMALFLPSFSTIVAFVGASCSFVVSILFPLLCYIQLYGATMSRLSKYLHYSVLVVNLVLCVVGTIAVFWPPPVTS